MRHRGTRQGDCALDSFFIGVRVMSKNWIWRECPENIDPKSSDLRVFSEFEQTIGRW